MKSLGGNPSDFFELYFFSKFSSAEFIPSDLVMKDLEIELFHLWGLKKPVQNADCVDGIKIKAANPFIDPFYGL